MAEEKMLINKSSLVSMADHVRAKTNTTATLSIPDGFNAAIDIIPVQKEEEEKTIDITENGTTTVVLPTDGKVLKKVTINVNIT